MASADHGSQVPDSDEPTTPMWLPAVGALLFLVVGIWWGTRPSEPNGAATADPAATATATATATVPARAAPAPHAPHPGHENH